MTGCSVCLEAKEWADNGLLSCTGCSLIVHKKCYGLLKVANNSSWSCDKCDSIGGQVAVACELCPALDGALKRTDTGGWAHIICALFVPEVGFGNYSRREPILLGLISKSRKFVRSCVFCEKRVDGQGNESATFGAFVRCNKPNCKQYFHATCGQRMGLICKVTSSASMTHKYSGYCSFHHQKQCKDYLIKPFSGIKCTPSKRGRKRKKRKGPLNLLSPDFDEFKPAQKSVVKDSLGSYTTTKSGGMTDATKCSVYDVLASDEEGKKVDELDDECDEGILKGMGSSLETAKNGLLACNRAFEQRVVSLENKNKRRREANEAHVSLIQELKRENQTLRERLDMFETRRNMDKPVDAREESLLSVPNLLLLQ